MRDDELLEQLRAGVRHLGENPRNCGRNSFWKRSSM